MLHADNRHQGREATLSSDSTWGRVNTERLFEALVSRLNSEALHVSTDAVNNTRDLEPQSTVLLDAEFNGVRYTLTRQPQTDSSDAKRDLRVLSAREKQIVGLVTEGYSNKRIALALNISAWTVATHLRRIFVKLGSTSRAEMVARVLREGLLGQ